jgi:methionine-rich copper-binding protein CopC
MQRVLSAVLPGVAAAALVLAAAAPASAHNYVVSSTPAEGEVLTALPNGWELVTNEAMLYAGNDSVFGLWARDAEGRYYGDGCVDVSGSTMSASPVIGEAGDYTLVYSLISADGHPLTGEIPFEWAPSGEHDAGTGTTEPVRCGVEVPPPTDGAESSGSIDLVWIVAGAGAVGLAVLVAVLVGRRPKTHRDEPRDERTGADPTT